VRQLGAPSFQAREDASRRLLRLGRSAAAALRAGLKDPDAEVRRRCAPLLLRAELPELEPRLLALLEGNTRSITPPLPGWECFRQAAGDDASARMLYADLYRAERPLLELLQRDPRQAAAQVVSRTQRLQPRLYATAQAGKPRLAPTELPALVLAAAAAPDAAPLSLHAYVQLLYLFYQPEARAQAAGDLVLRRLLVRVMARRGADQFTIYQTVSVARNLGLTEFIDGTLKPAVARQLEAALSQPPDLNKLMQAANLATNLDLGDASPRLKAAVRKLAETVAATGDYNRVSQVYYLLRNLKMEGTVDAVLKPAVLKQARAVADSGDVNRFYQVFYLAQSMALNEALDALRPGVCKLLAASAGRPDDFRFQQALTLARQLGLEEAVEAVVRPAVRQQVLAALEQGDDFPRLGRAASLATSVNLRELIDETLKPLARRRIPAALGKSPTLAQLQQAQTLAQQLGLGDVTRDAIKPAFAKALRAACERPVRDTELDQALNLARTLQSKEAADLAVKGALAKGINHWARGRAVLFVASFGTREQAERLTPLLKETTAMGSLGINGQSYQAQLGDVVLAALVHASGQALATYGFSPFATLPGAAGFAPSPGYFGFPDAATRSAARARWEKWAAANKKK
jgi:hypothetical protein